MRIPSLTFGLVTLLCLATASCAPMPAPFATLGPRTADQPPPQLVPLDSLLAQAAVPSGAEARATTLAARAARLKARAGLMRGPVLDPDTRARLAAAIRAGRA